MSDYEEDEMSEAELAQEDAKEAVTDSPTVQIHGLKASDIRGILTGLVQRAIRSQDVPRMVRHALEVELKKTVSEAAPLLVAEKMGPQVEAILTEGWHETDGYGNLRGGNPITVRKMVTTYLATKPDSYRSETRADKMIGEYIAKLVDKELGAELAAMRTKIRNAATAECEKLRAELVAQVNTIRTGKLSEAMAQVGSVVAPEPTS